MPAKTIGVALSDLRRRPAMLARKKGAGGPVMGLPHPMDFGPSAEAALAVPNWAQALSAATGLSAMMWDGRLSSAPVNRLLIKEADPRQRWRAGTSASLRLNWT